MPIGADLIVLAVLAEERTMLTTTVATEDLLDVDAGEAVAETFANKVSKKNRASQLVSLELR